uniref:Uncharacterized protein n=1 Tax=Abalone asfa-like virus TaxID=2839893 RepID=A0A5K7XYM6_9VIRU|nr:hypothetical protein [Abalone asfa-like virus]
MIYPLVYICKEKCNLARVQERIEKNKAPCRECFDKGVGFGEKDESEDSDSSSGEEADDETEDDGSSSKKWFCSAAPKNSYQGSEDAESEEEEEKEEELEEEEEKEEESEEEEEKEPITKILNDKIFKDFITLDSAESEDSNFSSSDSE